MSSSATATRKLPQEEQRTIDDPFAFRIYAAAVFAVALGLLAWGAFIERGTVAGYGWRLLPWIVGALIVDLASLTTASRAKVQLSFSYPLLLAAAFIYDPTSSALVAIAGSMDPRELRHEVSILHGLFNRSQIALCVMSASAVFHALGGYRDRA